MLLGEVSVQNERETFKCGTERSVEIVIEFVCWKWGDYGILNLSVF